MASNITVDTLTKGATTLNTDEIVDTNSKQICKAWVNFNGSGTVAIRDSYNVSSITDNGVGNYTVNFSNAMSNTSYTIVGNGGGSSAHTGRTNFVTASPTNTSSAWVSVYHTSAIDASNIYIQVFSS